MNSHVSLTYAMRRARYQSLNDKRKLEIIDLVEKAPPGKKKDIATELSIPASTLSMILKNKAASRDSHAFSSTKKKRHRDPSRADVDAALFQWFTAVRARSIPIKDHDGESRRTGSGAGPCTTLDLLVWMVVTLEDKAQPVKKLLAQLHRIQLIRWTTLY